jgi:hypothetical protein
MRVVAFIDEPATAQRILEHVGLPSAPTTPSPARGPPQAAFDFEAA